MNEVEHIYVINLDKDTENLEKFTKLKNINSEANFDIILCSLIKMTN